MQAPVEIVGEAWNPKSIRILVVDDEKTARVVISKLLDKTGYKDVEVAEDGRKALDILKEKRFQLVLCDLHMPVLDGIGLVQEVRKKSEHGDMPIVMMSATEDLSIVYKCLQEGADDYLIKPIQVNAVKNLWQNVLRKRKEKDQASLLGAEISKSKALDEELHGLRKQIESLKGQFSEAVETPINVIARTIRDISKTEGLTEEVRSALSVIVKSLGSSNLYRPALSKAIDGGSSLDSMTKDWLSRELAYETGDDEGRQGPAVSSWPQVRQSPDGQQLALIRSWEFDVWTYEEEELLHFIEEMFKDFDLLNRFKIPEDKFRHFLIDTRNGYSRKNPYHNFRHAFDVTQSCYLFLTAAGAAEYLTHLEILALLLSGLTHDFEHPGLNNTFQSNTNSTLALRYNDRSVLENFHAARAFLLMRQPENDILANLTDTEYRELRKIIIGCILATDLSKHMEVATRFSTCVDNFTRDNREHRHLLTEILMKCADISNPTRPGSISKYWSQMVQEEFFMQGDKEKELGVPVSPFMDRDSSNLAKMTLGFIDFFVTPLYTTLGRMLPGLKVCTDRLVENRTSWANIIAEESKKQEDQPAASKSTA